MDSQVRSLSLPIKHPAVLGMADKFNDENYTSQAWRTTMKRILILTLFLLLPISSFAATLEVGSGKTYSTIQAAVNAAVAGDTVLIYSGTYTDSCLISTCGGASLPEDSLKHANVVLKANGTSGNRITIKAAPGNTVIVDGQSTVDYNLYGISKQYYTIQGITFKDAKQTSIRYIGGSSLSAEIDGNTFNGTLTNPNDHGVELNGNSSNITGNTFSLSGSFATIDIENATNTSASMNTITGGSYGIYFHNYTDGSTIEKNILTGQSGNLTGIFFRDADNLTIRNNVVKGNYSNIMILYQDTTHISTGAKVYNNTIHCTNGGAKGIHEENTWAETTNNIIYNCHTGIYGIDYTQLPAGQPGYNDIYGATNKYYDHSRSQGIWPIGTGNITSDPQFVSLGTNYKLQSTSLAINAGNPSFKVPPSWGIVDMGRYEWTSSGVMPNEPTGLKVQ